MDAYELFGSDKEYLRGVKGFILDFDGTLVDSMPYWHLTAGDSDECLDLYDYMKKKYNTDVVPKPGAIELLEKLRSAGIPACIATDTPRYLSEGFFRRFAFDGLIEFYIGCDEVEAYKSVSPKIYHAAAERLGLAPHECLAAEDYLTSARTAKKAGFRVLGVYDAISAGDEAELRRVCDGYTYGWNEF